MSSTTEYWEDRWQKEETGWDLGKANPALVEFLEESASTLLEEGIKTAIYPGCGSGYDLIEFRKAGFEKVYGLDISPTAMKRFQELYPEADGIEYLLADFFSFKGTFDLLFDYTFACAIQPLQREQWGHKVAELVRPGGYALILMFPLWLREGGPPFKFKVSEYCRLLEDKFDPIFIKQCDGVEQRKPFQRLSLWKRKVD